MCTTGADVWEYRSALNVGGIGREERSTKGIGPIGKANGFQSHPEARHRAAILKVTLTSPVSETRENLCL